MKKQRCAAPTCGRPSTLARTSLTNPAGGRWRLGLEHAITVCAVVSCGVAVAQDCRSPQLQASVGQVASRWKEFDQRDRQLLRERGPLTAVGLVARVHCFDLDWQAGVQDAQGRRDYFGTSTAGGFVRTDSHIEQTEVRLEVHKAMTARWRLGVRIAHQDIQRELASVGPVQGYPERYRYWRAALATGYTLVEAGTWDLRLSASIGGGPPGRMQLRLPGDDPATLVLGGSKHIGLGLDWYSRRQATDTPGWSWQLAAHYQVEQIEAGRARAITRNGVVVGAALQPRIRQSALGLAAGLHYAF